MAKGTADFVLRCAFRDLLVIKIITMFFFVVIVFLVWVYVVPAVFRFAFALVRESVPVFVTLFVPVMSHALFVLGVFLTLFLIVHVVLREILWRSSLLCILFCDSFFVVDDSSSNV